MPIAPNNRIAGYKFLLRKFPQPQIGSADTIRCIVLFDHHANSQPVHQVTSIRNRRSYQEEQFAYFVPGAMDPTGQTVFLVRDWLDNICNFGAGAGDCMTLGGSYVGRECVGWICGTGDMTDYDSGCHNAGGWAGTAADCIGGGGIVKGGIKQLCKRRAKCYATKAAKELAEQALKDAATNLAKNIKQQEFLYDVVLKRAKDATDAGNYNEAQVLLKQAELIQEGLKRLRGELQDIFCQLGLG